jgi:hypothetical protein
VFTGRQGQNELSTIASAQLQEKRVGIVSAEQFETFDSLVHGKNRPHVVQFRCI